MDSTLKSEKNVAADFGFDQMMLKDTTVVEVDMEEPEKAETGSGEHKTMEAADVTEHGQPVQVKHWNNTRCGHTPFLIATGLNVVITSIKLKY